MKKILIMIALAVSSLFIFAGCTKEQAEDANYFACYIDKGNTTIKNEYFHLDMTGSEEILDYLMQKKLTKNGEDMDDQATIPPGVNVSSYSIVEDTVIVDFDEGYSNLSTSREILTRAGIVLTLSQIPGIKYVDFLVMGQDLRDEDGVLVGHMQASDFVSNLDLINDEGENITVYFANEEGSALIPYTLNGIVPQGKSLEEVVIEKVIEGPKRRGYIATLSKGVNLISAQTADGICYVNFDDSFNSEAAVVSDELAIYSIVNSLLELPSISQVQISINGDSAVKYHGAVSIEEPFGANTTLIQK